MSCGVGCSGGPSKYSPEFNKKWKAENNAGCCCNGSDRNNCDKPSIARKGSPRWEWEQKYGKIITKIIFEQDSQGHTVQRVEKTVCPPEEPKRPNRTGCCSLRYRVQR